jgi:hypothetical protein
MADSDEFGYVLVENLSMWVDNLEVYRRYLDLAIDTVIRQEPVCNSFWHLGAKEAIRNNGGVMPPNMKKEGDDPNEGYFLVEPVVWWFQPDNRPLSIGYAGCTRGQIPELSNERITLPNSTDLAGHIMDLLRAKDFETDVLPHIPAGELRGCDIQEAALQHVLSRPAANCGEVVVTGEDLRGLERIGYTLTQGRQQDSYLPILKMGLCKAYYPK